MVVRQKEGVKEGSEIPPKMFRIGLLEGGGDLPFLFSGSMGLLSDRNALCNSPLQ